MNEIQKLTADGFNHDSHARIEIDLALTSLKIALRSYFSTYQTFKYSLNIFDDESNVQESTDSRHNFSYCEFCAETILHFQHFAELVCKEFLRDDHPLLATTSLQKPDVLHKLLHDQSLTEDEEVKLRSIEFSVALETLVSLIKNESIANLDKVKFVKDYYLALKELNNLRNKIWHRGLFILRYPSLDEFIGRYILPFVKQVTSHPKYESYDHIWKYNELTCGIDPIEEIIDAYSTVSIETGKIAFLKELGRAAYINPLSKSRPTKKTNTYFSFSEFIDRKHIERAKRIAASEAELDFSEIFKCPVCGIESLIAYSELDDDFPDHEKEPYVYTYKVECECCKLNIEGGIKNPSGYGYSEIPDFF